MKQKTVVDGKEIDTEPERVLHLIKKSEYQEYIPIEMPGACDPKVKVEALITKVKKFIEYTYGLGYKSKNNNCINLIKKSYIPLM